MNALAEKYLSRYEALLRFPNLIGSNATHKILQSNCEDLRTVVNGDTSYCAISVFVPSEILNSLGVHYLPLEPVIATASQLGIVTEFKDIRDNILVFDTSCCGGQSLLCLYERSILPLPKYLIACSHMCDDSLKTFNYIAQHYGIPIFNLDIPYRIDDQACSYVADQLTEMIDFICHHEGVDFTIERLRECVEISNRTNAFRQQVFGYCRDNPPVLKMSAFLPAYPVYTKFGRVLVEKIYQELADEIGSLVDKEQWAYADGCYRILWMGMIPLTFPRLFSFLDSLKLGFPMTELMLHSDCQEMETRDPIQGVAGKLLNYPLVGSTEKRVKKIQQVTEEYSIEGVIHFNHRGCTSFNGDNFALADCFREKSIPFLVLDGDIADKEYCSEAKLQEHVVHFHNILEEKYGKR